MKQISFLIAILCYWHISSAQHDNILISSLSQPNEPSICINPSNPRFLVAGANLNNVYRSSDTGKTWQNATLSSTYGVWGDPVVLVDTAGAFYYFHLSNPSNGSWIDRIVCQKTTNNGVSWNNGSYTGLNGTKAQDKQWGVIDRKRNIIYLTWTQFDNYGSSAPADSSHILFSRSTDGGLTWTTAKKIDKQGGDCVDSDNTVEGAVPTLGPQGQLYVSWAGPAGLYFSRSLNGGNNWLYPKVIGNIGGGWDYNIPGLGRCNGLPVTDCDRSNGPYKGTIYINWSDQRNGSTNTDIWLIKSTNGGRNWSQPIKVNNDNSNRHQFLTWMTVDQITGHLWFVFYDRRNTTGNATEVYMARSTDGGQTFTNFKISESAFTPNSFVFFGDYNNLTAHNNIVRPIWTRMDGTSTSVYTALVNPSSVVNEPATSIISSAQTEGEEYPNPFKQLAYVSFKVKAPSKVTIQVFNTQGQMVATPIENKHFDYGKYIETLDFSQWGVKPGTYYIHLKINDSVKKIVATYLQ
jgi:hypothetical protein